MSDVWQVEVEESIVLSYPDWGRPPSIDGITLAGEKTSTYAQQAVSLIKVFWEAEFRAIMTESGMPRTEMEKLLEYFFEIVKVSPFHFLRAWV